MEKIIETAIGLPAHIVLIKRSLIIWNVSRDEACYRFLTSTWLGTTPMTIHELDVERALYGNRYYRRH